MPSSSLSSPDHITGFGAAAQIAMQIQAIIRYSVALTATHTIRRIRTTIMGRLVDIPITARLAMTAIPLEVEEDSIMPLQISR